MKKIMITLILVILITACNVPQVQPTATISQNEVETEVARQLSATAAQPTQPGGETSQPQPPTETPLPPTSTPTPTETATATPTLTPTLDWKANLGTPAWQSTLDSPSAFFSSGNSYSDDYTTIIIAGGVMRLSSSSTFGYRGWRLTSKKPQNFYLEAKFNTISCSGNDTYGLVLRAPDYSSGYGYYYTLTCDGKYALTKWNDDGSAVVLDLTPGSSIRSGAGQTNTFGIWIRGSEIKLYANDVLLAELSDSAIPNAGHIGVFIAGRSGGMTVELDEIAYWNQ